METELTRAGERISGSFSRFDARIRRIELNNVEHIGPEAFKNCSSLESIVISSNLEDIDDHAFKGCRSLSSVVFEPVEVEGDTQPEGLDIGIEAFADCTGLKRVDLSLVGEELSVDFDAFAGCSSLVSLDLSCVGGAKVNTMAHAFAGCSSLQSLILPDVVLAWNFKDSEGLFDGCTALKHWSAPASWPLRPATIPKPTSPNGAWWSLRDKRWLTVEEISQRGRVADAYYAEETGALSSINGEDATNHPILSRREREGRG